MRVEGKCCGDCGSCQLLADGQVDMIPCVLDQIFQRLQRLEQMNINKGKKRTNIAELPTKEE
jgi:transposase